MLFLFPFFYEFVQLSLYSVTLTIKDVSQKKIKDPKNGKEFIKSAKERRAG